MGLLGKLKSLLPGSLPAETSFSNEYDMLHELTPGSMSRIYKARHTKTGQIKCVKKITPTTPERHKKLLREIEVAFQLAHENIVRHEAYEKKENTYLILMEFIEGISLRAFLRKEIVHHSRTAPFLSGRDFLNVFRGCARGLSHLHGKGFLHMDIKPENVLVSGLDHLGDPASESGDTTAWKQQVLEKSSAIQVRLIDFGVALRDGEDKSQAGGSVFYLAPEVLAGPRVPVGTFTDLYSLGATLFEVATGSPPFLPTFFEGKPKNWNFYWNDYERVPKVARSAYESDLLHARASMKIGWNQVPYADPIRKILARCLEMEPAKRYPDTFHLLQDLERLL